MTRAAFRNPFDPYAGDAAVIRGRPSWMDIGLDGPAWLYGFGDWERYRLLRLREAVFREVAEVGYPGDFPSPAAARYFRRRFDCGSAPTSAPALFYHSGEVVLRVNGHVAARFPATARPVRRSVDLAPWLRPGGNTLSAAVFRRDEPPALYFDWLSPDQTRPWEVSADSRRWEAPERYPYTVPTLFPHQERLPTVRVEARQRKNGLHDLGALHLGWTRMLARGRGMARVYPGETPEEALADGATQETAPVAREAVISDADARAGREAEIPGVEVVLGPMACRYLRLETSGEVALDAMHFEAEGYPVEYRGHFRCSDDELQSIWGMAAATLRLCLREFVLDGIKRDRLPWAGDLAVAVDANAHVFADAGAIRRTLTALAPARPDQSDVNGIADYTFHWLLALHRYWRYHADVDHVRRLWPDVCRVLAAVAAPDRRDGEGGYEPSPDSWVFVDWGERPEAEGRACLQMLYAAALDAAADLAEALDETADAGGWRALAAQSAATARRRHWREADGWFAVSDGEPSRPLNALAVVSGVATGEQARRVAASVLSVDRGAPAATPFMTYFELEALSRAGGTGAALSRLRAGWGGMLTTGTNTFWEAWRPELSARERQSFYGRPFGLSACHAWSAGPVALLSGGLAGLRPLAAGWRRFSLARRLPPDARIDWLELAVPTPRGTIVVEARGGTVELLSSPPGCECVRTP